ncbi:hypothetical protein FGG78_22070 [Thioclava sp. BHET1]|nr:hypothetical protein FGG78_22070 [Thioclava sp. BHET1]
MGTGQPPRGGPEAGARGATSRGGACPRRLASATCGGRARPPPLTPIVKEQTMDVATTTSATTAQTKASSETGATTGTVINSDFTMFLKMLTTQIKNQDPLDPMDSTDFAVQLATFSGVEQQTRTNDLLEGLTSQISGNSLEHYASWIGKEVQTTDATPYSGSGSVTLHPEAVSGAATALLVVSNASGAEIAHLSVPATGEPVAWSGTDDNGAQSPAGLYRYTLESFDAEGTALGTSALRSYDRITEVQSGEGGVTFILSGGSQIPASEVSALRSGD